MKTKTSKQGRLMPEHYIRLNSFIVHKDTYNYILSDVQIFKDGNSIGQEYSCNDRFYSSLERVVSVLGEEVAFKYFPDFVKINQELQELRELVKKGLKL